MASRAGRVHLKDVKEGKWYWSITFVHGTLYIYRCQVELIRFRGNGILFDHGRPSPSKLEHVFVMNGYVCEFDGKSIKQTNAKKGMNSIYSELELGLFADGYVTNKKKRVLNQVDRMLEVSFDEVLFESYRKAVTYLKTLAMFGVKEYKDTWLAKRMTDVVDPKDAERDFFNVWTGQSPRNLDAGLSEFKELSPDNPTAYIGGKVVSYVPPAGEMPKELQDFKDEGLETEARLKAATGQ